MIVDIFQQTNQYEFGIGPTCTGPSIGLHMLGLLSQYLPWFTFTRPRY